MAIFLCKLSKMCNKDLYVLSGVGSTVKLIRIGKQSSVHKDVQYLCLDNLIQKNIQSGEFKWNG